MVTMFIDPSLDRRFAPTFGKVDWNADFAYGSDVAVDLNGDGELTSLPGFNDWEQTHPAAGVTSLTNMATGFHCNTGAWGPNSP